MFESVVLGLFISILIIFIVFKLPILYALIIGMFIFALYSLKSGYSKRETLNMLLEGVLKIKNIIIIFCLIGGLTAVWRISGTIPFILYHSVNIIKPEIFVLCTFLLCSFMSFLIGTSMGTAGTMGVICMMISNTLGINPLITGGAVMSGIYFGDRMSPMSSSAQLVSAITESNIYTNLKNMFYTSIVPFIASFIFYIVICKSSAQNNINLSQVDALNSNFNLNYITAIPAVLIIVFAFLKINVKKSMTVSILVSSIIAVIIQKIEIIELLKCILFGFSSENEIIGKLLNGGGISSMVKVSFIVLVSATYSGILSKTKILDNIKKAIKICSKKISPFGATFITSIIANSFGCNQTLGVMLTGEMCKDLYIDKSKFAVDLENTAIITAPLIFWNIASAVPIETIGADTGCIIYAVYLYMIPIWNFIVSFKKTEGEENIKAVS